MGRAWRCARRQASAWHLLGGPDSQDTPTKHPRIPRTSRLLINKRIGRTSGSIEVQRKIVDNFLLLVRWLMCACRERMNTKKVNSSVFAWYISSCETATSSEPVRERGSQKHVIFGQIGRTSTSEYRHGPDRIGNYNWQYTVRMDFGWAWRLKI